MLGLDHSAVVASQVSHIDETVPPLPQGSINVEPVPEAQREKPQPLLKILMPVVILVAIGAMVAILALSGRGVSPMMLIFPLMMVFSVLMMINPPEKTSDIDETRRVYLRHLDAVVARARRNADMQRRRSEYFHPNPHYLLGSLPTSRVWERRQDHARVLEVRLGLGATSLCTPIEVGDPGSPEDLDPVCAVSLRRTVASVDPVHAMPIVVQLGAFPAITLVGPRADDVARSVICQLAFFHGPDVVGVDNLHSDPAFEWMKWLPHTRAPESAEFLVAIVDASKVHSAMMNPANDCVITVHPDPEFFVDEDAFHLICTDTITARTLQGDEVLGTSEGLNESEAVLIARHLAFYKQPTKTVTSAGGTGELLPMLGIDDIDRLDPHTMWPGHEGTRQRLTVPLGVTPDGAAVHLDLKESAHGGMGPHGLCIGATGSGKSELLKTLVVALAATHSPDELNLVLVDFKGGATFLGSDALPHTSAVITNLEDESVLVERMFDAISGELNRRQELLRSAGNLANISDYSAARLDGRVDLAPLPALLIVVDEFSELLSQHPHFVDLFVAVGRLGRSLGVHLLLASQRLEEGKLRGLDSHLSYRIGLKTFSAGESRQVLGVPDAYELPGDPGSGYLKAGSPELVRFRACYVSGPLTRRVVHEHSSDRPQIGLFHGWKDSRSEEESEVRVVVDETTTLFDAVVDKARTTAQLRGQHAHRVWLPPLPAEVELSAVCESPAPLVVSIGLVDDPYRQRQDHLTVDFSTAGGHLAIAGGPRTGKSMTLRTIVAALAVTHSTDDIAVYIVDAGAGEAAELESLPHVAGTASRTEEEKVRRIVDEVMSFVDTPATVIRRHIFLVVDGWHAIVANDSKLEDLRDPLGRIASEGPAAGVHLVVSTQRWGAIRANVRDLIGTRLELHMAEPFDSLIDRKAQQKLPSLPGRGLSAGGKYMLVAATHKQDLAHILTQTSGQTPVPGLKVLPDFVSVQSLIGTSELPPIAIGIGGPNLDTVRCTSGHLLAIGAAGSGKTTLIASVITAVGAMPRESARMVIVDQRRAHLTHFDDSMVASYAATPSAVAEAIAATVTTLRARLPGPEITAEQLAAQSWWQGPDIYLIIDDLDLVGEEHLRELVGLFPHARDIGLHIFAARKLGGVSRALYSGFLSALKDLNPDVLIFDGNRDEGMIFGVKPGPLPPGRATLVRGGQSAGIIQVASPLHGEHTR